MENDSLENLVSERAFASPIDMAAYGRAMSDKLGNPQKWANELYLSFENSKNAASKAQFAVLINNWLKYLAEHQPPPLNASDLTDEHLAQALERIDLLKNELQANRRQSDTFGVG